MQLTIGELAATAAAAVSAAQVRGANRRITDLPDERTIRWYASIGLVDRPSGSRGRTALYDERHVLQLLAIKRRQAQGRTLAEIQAELVGATDRTLRRIADVSEPIEAVEAAEVSDQAVPAAGGRRFWSEPPAPDGRAGVLTGVELGDGVVLMVPGEPSPSDVQNIRAAATPLLDLLAQRRLTRGSAS
jgi:DNA-binding transcriptional MerR regulator